MDHYILANGPTQIDVGSYLLADPGPDFDFGSLFQSQYIENAAVDGGVLAYEHSGIRKFKFPLRLASSAAFTGGLNGLEALIRKLARPGAVIDLLPDSTPSGEAVRFDVLNGRVDDVYSLPVQRLARRSVTLELAVKPFGYWPTQILLASGVSPSYQDTFALTWNPASILGDAPAQAILAIAASVATHMTAAPTLGGAYAAGQHFQPDGLWWSMARPSGATGFLVPSDLYAATLVNQNVVVGSNNILRATVGQTNAAPFGAYLRLDLMASGGDAWKMLAVRQFAASHAQAYAGRYRVYGMLRWWHFSPVVGGQQATMPLQISLDEARGSYIFGNAPLASAYPVATLIPVQPSGGAVGTPWIDAPVAAIGGLNGATEPAFHLVDLGEHTFPPNASGAWSPFQLRLWGRMPTSYVGTFPRLDVAGIRLQALDGPAGILTRGMILPTTNNIVGTDGAGNFWGAIVETDSFVADTPNNRLAVFGGSGIGGGSNLASPAGGFAADARGQYLGALPVLAGTEMQLDVGYFDRPESQDRATTAVGATVRTAVSASVHYRPRFAFLKGL